jgi:hypothetical protein
LLLRANSGFVVIANPSVGLSSISADDLKGVYLTTKTSLPDGSHIEPVLVDGGEAHEAFLKTCIGRSNSALRSYYRSLAFTGKAFIPRTFDNEAQAVAYVARHKGTLAYVSAGADITGVKTLAVK